MYDKVANDASVYTNVQGLEQLRADVKNNPKAAKKEVSQQFEAILVQMMLRSMRDANKSFSSDLLNNDQMDFYQDLFDKQLSLALSSHGMGVAGAIEKNIDEHHLAGTSDETPAETPPALTLPERIQPQQAIPVSTQLAAVAAPQTPPKTENVAFDSQESFIKHLWPTAKFAAKMIGVSPEVLIAQAALETNWGKKILPHNQSTSSFNLFNIKAGGNWAEKTTTMDSLEQRNGVLVKEKSSFRSYESFKESFADYIHLLQQNSRYKDALDKATNPQEFVHALQNAGYATDSNYADKILKIFDSRSFQNVIAKLQ
jgi:flagellar protein FlgJ